MSHGKKQQISAIASTFLIFVGFLLSSVANAVDYYFSGFGTAGYAISDVPNDYRQINNGGTFAQDSLIGGQLDLTFSPQWQATIQAKISSGAVSHNRWRPALSYAFISWRPSDDLLFRFGKLHVPALLQAENLDIGKTYDIARIPLEVVTTSPAYDFIGTAASKSWNVSPESQLALEGYFGYTTASILAIVRQGIPAGIPGVAPVQQGARFVDVKFKAAGAAITLRQPNSSYRFSLHYGITQNKDGSPSRGPSIKTPIGLYRPTEREDLKYVAAILSTDAHLGKDFFLTAELVRRFVLDMPYGHDSTGIFLQLRKNIGHFVPYIAYAQLKTDKAVRNIYDDMKIPRSFPIGIINRAQADALLVTDQSSWMLGTAFHIDSNSSIKTEFMHTRIGQNSAYLDAPPGEDVRGKRLNTLSLSYNFIF